MIIMPGDYSCYKCKHLHPKDVTTDTRTCNAFPNGIPDKILWEDVEHNQPYAGDGGIQFEKELDKR
jgi:hypothetical protein